ncbi:MAG TPA: hypothetical protein VG917_00470 [Patescibacteria group bacterium]|nr:hypothetical protein [Patescibacteria group bacterium]
MSSEVMLRVKAIDRVNALMRRRLEQQRYIHDGAISRNNQNLAIASRQRMDKYQIAINVMGETDDLILVRHGNRNMKIEGSIDGHKVSVSTWMSSNHFRFDGSAGEITRKFGGTFDGKELNAKQAHAFFSRYLYVLKHINSSLAFVKEEEEKHRRIEERIRNQL